MRPASVAVFGGRWATNVIEQCRRLGYAGEIWPVHPERRQVCGLPCFASIDALPGVPDASFLGVNAEATVGLVAALAARGAGGAVCFAAGFDEVAAEDPAGPLRQRRLLDAARDMPMIGPNCYGYVNCLDGAALWPDQHGAGRVERGVALLTQSSNLAINLTMQRRGLPIAMLLTAGNQAQLPLATLAAAVIEDERISALGLHVEGFADIRAWEALAARAKVLGKPVVVLKSGRSDAARGALVSHTRSIAGSTAASDAFLARLGVHRVDSVGVLLETLALLHVHGALARGRLLSMSCSGGEAALIADACATAGLECPPLTARRTSALREVLGPTIALANPLDYNTWIWNDATALEAMMRATLDVDGKADADDADGACGDDGTGNESVVDAAVLVLDMPREDRCDAASWRVTVDAFVRATRRWPGAACLLSTLDENLPEALARSLHAERIVPLRGIENGIAALAAAVRPAASGRATPCRLPTTPGEGFAAPGTSRLVDETGTKAYLARFGVAVPASRSCAEVDDAFVDDCLASLAAPLVVKGRGLSHKSELGAIVLGVDGRDALVAALDRVRDVPSSGGAAGGPEDGVARVRTGALVEEQVPGVIVELLVGIVADPVHGWLLSIAAGGVLAELLHDSAQALLPVDARAVDAMLSALRLAPVLDGYRGRPAIDRGRVVDAVLGLQAAALELGDALLELEVNPLLCTSGPAIAGDALMSLRCVDPSRPDTENS